MANNFVYGGQDMTTFESLLLIAVTAIVIILAVGVYGIAQKLKEIISWKESIWNELRGIRVNVADTAEYTHNHIAPDVEIISNNFLHLLDERSVYKQPTSVNGTPCYAPDGICTNPQMDCINCPKHRSSGGTWLTSTNISKNDE